MKIGVLHPGMMGASVGDALLDAGHTVYWCAAGRSAASRQRAARWQACAELGELCDVSEVVISVCPPDQALSVANEVVGCGFSGLYVDANAVAPQSAQQIGALISQHTDISYVDGGIIGPPARSSGSTRLYLSGEQAHAVAEWFEGSLLDAVAIPGDVCAASALKMAYAAYTKGSAALLLAVNALAQAYGVGQQLNQEWHLSQAALPGRSAGAAAGTAPKAWRFEGEMREIADTFAAVDLPDGFHTAAAELYGRMAQFKDQSGVDLAQVIEQLLRNPAKPSEA